MKKTLSLVVLCCALLGLQNCTKDKKKNKEILSRLADNMVSVAGGTFTMGCTSEQASECLPDEKPAHQITLSGFRIGKYEVTQEEWKAVMGNNPSYYTNCDKCPVETVSWEDIQSFLNKLNSLTGGKYRLPTEAEWEFAARGGIKSSGFKYSGGNKLDVVAWYGDTSGRGDIPKTGPRPVGQKAGNELGLHDMSGNVGEWCNDWFGGDYYANSPSTNPAGPSTGTGKVYRGGVFHGDTANLRVSSRIHYTNTIGAFSIGFRLVAPEL
jgi:sulfatase modifying factor 1